MARTHADVGRVVRITALIGAVALGVGCSSGSEQEPGAAATAAPEAEAPADVEPAEPSEEMEEEIASEAAEKLAERRQAMMQEAHAALDETNAALKALDEGKTRAALDALARATGKLELLVARDPDLALAPVEVEFVTHDLHATVEAIEEARSQAEELLEEGRVQDARSLVSGLASEFVIRVSHLPLATYPEAIKEVSPLIDEGRIDEAKAALREALGTLVVTDRVIPLPLARADHMLVEAERLSQSEEPSDEDRTRVEELLEGARYQLEMAEALGYGDEDDHEKLGEQIAELRRKLGADEETEGIFARLRRSLSELRTSLVDSSA